MKNGTMFSNLQNYKDYDFLRNNDIIRFETLDECKYYKIVSVLLINVDDFNLSTFKHFPNNQSKINFLQFITTHSLNVVLEAEWHNIFVKNKFADTLSVLNKEMEGCRRSNPQAFFAKKIICCEGKTEQGFIRAIDSWIYSKYNTSLSAKGVVIVNAGGGNKMFTYARNLKELGYDTCVFADDDKPKELKEEKQASNEVGVKLLLCETGNSLERQIILDLPWNFISTIVNCSQEDFPNDNINLDNDFLEEIKVAREIIEQNKIRNTIIELAIKKNKEWFKHIPGGEFLGSVFSEAYNDMGDNKNLKINVKSLLKWCSIEI